MSSMKDKDRNISAYNFREWVNNSTDEELDNFLELGVADIIYDLEADDYFGTEGLNKRFG